MVCEVQWLQTANPDTVSPWYLERQDFTRSEAKQDVTGESAAQQCGRIYKACWSAQKPNICTYSLTAGSSALLMRAIRRAANSHGRLGPADDASLKKRQRLGRGDSWKWSQTSHDVWWMSCDSAWAQVMEAGTLLPCCRYRQPCQVSVTAQLRDGA